MDLDDCLQNVEEKVTNGMNLELDKPFTRDEVLVALNQMAPLKSPSPYGFNVRFYQTYWQDIGDEVSNVALKFLHKGIFDDGFIYTYIVLIPNINRPRTTGDLRPISLCNVVYKLVSKSLAN